MESIAGTRSLRAALRRGPGRADTSGLALGGAALALVAGLDIALGSSATTGTYVLVPFFSATFGAAWATALLAIACLGLGAGSGEWNMNFGEGEYWIHLGLIAAGGSFALVAAVTRQRAHLNSRRLEVLNEIGAIADGSLTLDDTLARVTELIVPAAADLCMVDAIHDGRVMRVAVQVGDHPDAATVEERLRRRRPSVPEWLVEDVWQWRHIPRFMPRMREEDVRRMSHDADDLDFLRSLKVRSSITAPMIARGRNMGALTIVGAWSARHYGNDDVRFAQILAGRVALALDNAGLFSDLESVERRMDAVMSMISDAVAVHDATGKLVYVNDSAARRLGFAGAEELLRAPADQVESRYRVFTEDGEPLRADHLAERHLRQGLLPWRGMVRVVFPPAGEERWMRINSDAIRGPGGAVLYAVTTIEDVTEVKRAELAQRLLARTGELLASSIDHRRTLADVARVAVPQFADWCTVNVAREDGLLEQVAVAHSDPDRVEFAHRLRERYPLHVGDEGGLARVIRDGEPMLIEDAEPLLREVARDEEHLRLMRSVGIGSAILVPMRAGARIVGALSFVSDRGSRRFDRADVELAEEIGHRAGLAIENARLATANSEVARILQQGLKPAAFPSIPGWRMATMYRPAGEVSEVGGDFFDAFLFGGGWMIVAGDVVGRGPAAASLTALARYTIRTAGTLTGDAVEALRMLDQALKELDEPSLCSAIVLALPGNGNGAARLRAVSAGHPPPLLIRGGEVHEIDWTGPLLGAVEDPSWQPRELTLEESDQLVVYTDGITEARGASERFGDARLRAELAGVRDPESAVERLERALDRFCVSKPEDDAAAVVIQRRGVPIGARAAGVVSTHWGSNPGFAVEPRSQ